MFQLIVAVISIALVAALALASIFYGGEAFTRGQLKAQVATMINQAQQISGANTLYKTDNGGSNATVVDELTVANADGFAYLAAAPDAPSKIATGEWLIGVDGDGKAVTYVELLSTADLAAIEGAVDDANVGNTGAVGPATAAFYFPL